MKEFLRQFLKTYAPFRWAMLGVLGFIALSQALNLVAPYLQGRVVDGLINKLPLDQLMVLAAMAFLVWTLQLVGIMYGREIYETKYTDFAIPQHVSQLTMERLLSFSIGQHIGENSGFKQSVISRGQHSLTTLAYMVLYQVLPMVVEVLLLVSVLLWRSPVLGVIVCVGMGLYLGLTVYSNMHFREDFKTLETRHNENSKHQGEVMRNVELVLATAQESRMVRECDQNLSSVFDFAKSMWIRFASFVAARNMIISFTRLGFLMTGILLVTRSQHTVGELVMFMAWANQVLSSLFSVGSIHRQMMQAYASVRKYFDMLAIESDVKLPVDPVRPERFLGRIEFRDVSFRYQRRDGKKDAEDEVTTGLALDHVSFIIEPGEVVAVVGESGAGKSTLTLALLRGQDPESGSILIDGIDLRDLDLGAYRQAIGIVPQFVPLFDETIRYNVTFGLNGHSTAITDADLDRISAMACIDRFFPRLERGYDTYIGERGVKLSGGERQRIGIARALIKDPQILIFDEATSSLDAENEGLIRESIERVSEGRTTIIIAHRFSTIRNVDRVIVMERGRIVGQGTHAELAVTCEVYQRLVKNQVVA